MTRQIPTQTGFPIKKPIYLYYRDPIECLEAIMQNPLVTDAIGYSPVRVYRAATRMVRVYSGWLTGDSAWDVQVCHCLVTSSLASF